MFPAHAPLPTDSSLPFQLVAGIQISIRIAESLVGFRGGATRQIAGKFSKFSAGNPGNVGTAPGGNVSCPASTGCANVTVACGRAKFARFSQEVAASSGQESATTTTRIRIGPCHDIRSVLPVACNVRYAVGS